VYAKNNGRFTVGKTAKIRGNIKTSGGNNNVYLVFNKDIKFELVANAPAPGMEIHVHTDALSGIIVTSGAVSGDEQYFKADEAGKNVVFSAPDQLKIE
jgi:hypothetical protein